VSGREKIDTEKETTMFKVTLTRNGNSKTVTRKTLEAVKALAAVATRRGIEVASVTRLVRNTDETAAWLRGWTETIDYTAYLAA
jgi:hypothetical protein